MRLVAWRRSGSRLLLQGGLGNLEQRLPELAGQAVAQVGAPGAALLHRPQLPERCRSPAAHTLRACHSSSSCHPAAVCCARLQGRPQEVFGAFASFRQRRCKPYQPPSPAQQHEGAPGEEPAAAAAAAALAASARRGSSKELGAFAQQAALADRLVAAAELLHILRPVAYALALRK